MMTYEEFSWYVEDHVLDSWEERDQYEVEICPVIKNNGREEQNLQIRKKGEMIAPVLYLRDYYNRYREGQSVDQIMEAISRSYHLGMDQAAEYINLSVDPETIRENIIFRVVNYRKNRKILESAPHIRFSDLAVTFRWLTSCSGNQIGSVLIDDRISELLDMNREDLLQYALKNTERLFPPKICTMEEMMLKLMGLESEKGIYITRDHPQLYILTNQSGINGASSMLYDRLLADFADEKDTDFYIIPSSINEVLLMPVGAGMEPEAIRKMIREVNTVAVSPDEYLSDSLYCYEREKGFLYLVE